MTALIAVAVTAEAAPVAIEALPPEIAAGRRRARLGGWLTVAGPPLLLIGAGVSAEHPRTGGVLALGGLGATIAGPPLLASGTLVVQHELADRGLPVRPTAGRVAMGSWVAAMGVFGGSFVAGQAGLGDLAAFWAIGGSVVWLGSGIAGAVQGAQNAGADGQRDSARSGAAARAESTTALVIAVAPAWDHGPAFRLAVAW